MNKKLIVIIGAVVVLAVCGYFGARVYARGVAKEKVDNGIKKLCAKFKLGPDAISYKDMNVTHFFANTVLNDVTIKDKDTTSTIGVLTIENIDNIVKNLAAQAENMVVTTNGGVFKFGKLVLQYDNDFNGKGYLKVDSLRFTSTGDTPYGEIGSMEGSFEKGFWGKSHLYINDWVVSLKKGATWLKELTKSDNLHVNLRIEIERNEAQKTCNLNQLSCQVKDWGEVSLSLAANNLPYDKLSKKGLENYASLLPMIAKANLVRGKLIFKDKAVINSLLILIAKQGPKTPSQVAEDTLKFATSQITQNKQLSDDLRKDMLETIRGLLTQKKGFEISAAPKGPFCLDSIMETNDPYALLDILGLKLKSL